MSDKFSDMLGDDVKPLAAEKRVTLKENLKDASSELRRAAAESETDAVSDPLSEPTELVGALDVLSYQRPGVQHGVYKNLRLGKYAIDARIDLHKMTTERARRAIYQFIKDCRANDVRSALITHGKAEGRETGALLKSCVAAWLPQFEEVLAFHTAQKYHGGYGATYVLLKKSEKQKSKNREQLAKR